MKKIVLISFILLFLVSCGIKDNNNYKKETKNNNKKEIVNVDKGKKVVKIFDISQSGSKVYSTNEVGTGNIIEEAPKTGETNLYDFSGKKTNIEFNN